MSTKSLAILLVLCFAVSMYGVAEGQANWRYRNYNAGLYGGYYSPYRNYGGYNRLYGGYGVRRYYDNFGGNEDSEGW